MKVDSVLTAAFAAGVGLLAAWLVGMQNNSQHGARASGKSSWIGDVDVAREFVAYARDCGGRNITDKPQCIQRCAALAEHGVRERFRPAEATVSKEEYSCHMCPHADPRKPDVLFGTVEQWGSDDGRRGWGATLDAGSGAASLRWLLAVQRRMQDSKRQRMQDSEQRVDAKEQHQDTTRLQQDTTRQEQDTTRQQQHTTRQHQDQQDMTVTAVTASRSMLKQMHTVAPPDAATSLDDSEETPAVTLLVDDWADGSVLSAHTFDTVIADYLVGAVDGFSPYEQTLVIERVVARMRPGPDTRLFLIGTEPNADMAPSLGTHLILETARLRDACILLEGDRMYREFPRRWVQRALEDTGLRIVRSMSFPMVYGVRKLERQLDVCADKIAGRTKQRKTVANALETALVQRIKELRHQIRNDPELQAGLCYGHDYIIEAAFVF